MPQSLPSFLARQQDELTETLSLAFAQHRRMQRFFAGHEKDQTQLSLIMHHLQKAQEGLNNLDWPTSRVSDEWEKPGQCSGHDWFADPS